MKRRPTARDREIADYVCNKLPVGQHVVQVQHLRLSDLSYFSPARLKPEGGMSIRIGDKEILFIPELTHADSA